jgi:hypothetical protein
MAGEECLNPCGDAHLKAGHLKLRSDDVGG